MSDELVAVSLDVRLDAKRVVLRAPRATTSPSCEVFYPQRRAPPAVEPLAASRYESRGIHRTRPNRSRVIVAMESRLGTSSSCSCACRASPSWEGSL